MSPTQDVPRATITRFKLKRDGDTNGFYPHSYTHPPPGLRDTSMSTIKIVSCDDCLLFRSNRRAPEAQECGCTNPQLDKRTFKLNPWELNRGSDLDRYRNAIVNQLKKNPDFFLERFLEFQRLHAKVPDIWNTLFIHVTVEVVGDASGGNAINVRHVCVKYFDIHKQGKVEPLKTIAKGQTKSMNKWRKEHSGHVALGFAFDFKVYFPQKMVYFGVQMGLKLEKEQFDRLLKQSSSPYAELRLWRYRIFEALSDSDGITSPPDPLPSDCSLDLKTRNRLITRRRYDRLYRTSRSV